MQTLSIPFFGYEITPEGLARDLFLLRQRPETTQLKDVLLWNCCNYWIPASLSSPSQASSAVSLDPAKAWAPARGGDGPILTQATHSQVTHLQIN